MIAVELPKQMFWLMPILVSGGCYGWHGMGPGERDGGGGDRDGGAVRLDGGGPRILDPEAGPPDPDALDEACHPETVFVAIDRPGCVAREITGSGARSCSVDGREVGAGQPVTVLNRAGKDLTIDVSVVDVSCTSPGCVVVHADSVESCDCMGGGLRHDPWEVEERLEELLYRFRASVFVRSLSMLLGGDGVRFLVTVCTTD